MKQRLLIVTVLLVIVLGGIFGVKYMQSRNMQAGMAKKFPPTTIAATEVIQESWIRTNGGCLAGGG